MADVRNNPDRKQFETEGGRALLAYREDDGRIDLLHTEVPDELEGQGIGGALVKAALEHARAANLQVVPSCPFVGSYLRRHLEYVDLVAEEYRRSVRAD